MPIYEYRCRQGHTFEVIQSMSDDPVSACTECRAPVERVFRPVAVHFKGSGFYTTDYGRKRSSGAAGGSEGGSSEGESSKSDKSETSSSKSESKSETKSDSSSKSSGD